MKELTEDSPEDNNGDLSKREIEVLQLLADGKSNKQAADMLNVCKSTIDTHNAHIQKKLQACNMKHAVAMAIRNGLIK